MILEDGSVGMLRFFISAENFNVEEGISDSIVATECILVNLDV